MRSACAGTATSSSSTRSTTARTRSRPSPSITRPSPASWRTSITACPASRPRPSPPAARARPTCRSRSATPFSNSVPFLAVTGQRADEPVQPRRLPGALPPLPGGLPLDRARLLQARVPADPRRDGAARGAPGVEDHGDRAARPGGARRALRRVPRSRRRGDARSEGVDREHLLPLRRRPRGRREGGRPAARRRAAGDPHRPGRQVWRRRRRSAGARREALESRSRRRRAASAGSTPRIRWRSASSPATAAITRTTRRGRPTCCSRSACGSTTAPRARGCPATRSPSRRPSSSMSTSIPTRSAATIPSRSA